MAKNVTEKERVISPIENLSACRFLPS